MFCFLYATFFLFSLRSTKHSTVPIPPQNQKLRSWRLQACIATMTEWKLDSPQLLTSLPPEKLLYALSFPGGSPWDPTNVRIKDQKNFPFWGLTLNTASRSLGVSSEKYWSPPTYKTGLGGAGRSKASNLWCLIVEVTHRKATRIAKQAAAHRRPPTGAATKAPTPR